MSLLELLASAAGFASGFLAASLSVICSSRLPATDFWPRVKRFSELLVAADEQRDFLRQYIALWPVLGRYLARNLVLMIAALVPIILSWWLFSIAAVRVTCPSAVFVLMAPSQQVTIQWPGDPAQEQSPLSLQPHENRVKTAVGLEQPVVFSLPEGRLRCSTLIHKHAYASRWTGRLSFALLGFRTMSEERPPGNLRWLLVQPDRGDDNVLWPYLSDWEFVFFVAIALGALFVPISRRTKRS